MINEDVISRFHAKYTKSEVGCWSWEAGKNPQGYGQFYVRLPNGKQRCYKAHRLSFMLATGAIPAGLLVCHSCDNPSCVNPEHLWLGTHQDNSDDMVRKNRQAKGFDPHNKDRPIGGRPYKGGYHRPLSEVADGRRKRKAHGADNHQAKLTAQEVSEIRVHLSNYKTLSRIASAYGVGTSTIHRIKHRHSWK